MAGKLLALEDPSPYYRTSLVLGGPEDVNGRDIKALVEKITGVKVERVEYRNTDFLDVRVETGGIPKKLKSSMEHALQALWDGKVSCANMPTSQKALHLHAPTGTVEAELRRMTGN